MPMKKLRGTCPAPTKPATSGKPGIAKTTGTGREHRGPVQTKTAK